MDIPHQPSGETPVLSLSNEAFLELAEAVLEKRARLRVYCGGCSMHPFVRDGDIATLESVARKHLLRVGDIVLCRNPRQGKATIHRIIGKQGEGRYLLSGDNCWDPDGFVESDDVLGRVARMERAGRETCLGLGPERLAIVLLIRLRLLRPAVLLMSRLSHTFFS